MGCYCVIGYLSYEGYDSPSCLTTNLTEAITKAKAIIADGSDRYEWVAIFTQTPHGCFLVSQEFSVESY